MNFKKTATLLTIPTLALLSACSGGDSTRSEEPTNSTVTSAPAPSETTQVLSGGENGGEQVPQAAPTALTEISDEDRGNALAAGKNIIELYTAGGSSEEWHRNIAPNITPELQNLLANFNPEPSKATVTGDPEIIPDSKQQPDNPYWVTVRVPTDKGDYVARLKRQPEQPEKWKANEILPYQVFEKGQSKQ